MDLPGGRCRRTQLEVESDLHLIARWTDTHGLSLNPSKTSLLLVGSNPLLAQLNSFKIHFNDSVNQRDDRGRTIRVIRSQWDEKRGSMVVWSIGRFFRTFSDHGAGGL